MFTVQLVDISADRKLTILCRKLCLSHTLNKYFMLFSVLDKLLYGRYLKAVNLCKLHKVILSRHGSVVLHDLAAKSARLESCNLHEIHCRLCVSISLYDSACNSLEWEHVSRSSEVIRFCILIHKFSGCVASLLCRDSCGCVHMIHRHRKCCTVVICICYAHLWEIQLIRIRGIHRHAYETSRPLCHEVDILRCSKFCCTDYISLILSVLVVEHDNRLSRRKICSDLLYRVEFKTHHSTSLKYLST